MIIIGIDPGVSGAIAAIDHNGFRGVEDMPTISYESNGRAKRKIHGTLVCEVLRALVDSRESVLVLMEDVHAMPASKSGSSANASLMHSKGVLEGVLCAKGYPYTLVSPLKWKRFFGLIEAEKWASLDKAREFFRTPLLNRERDHNRAEALLIARYGLEKNL